MHLFRCVGGERPQTENTWPAWTVLGIQSVKLAKTRKSKKTTAFPPCKTLIFVYPDGNLKKD